MDTRLFDYVREIDKHGSLSKAAAHLFISQQGLNRFISTSEKNLGFALFERNNKGVELTAEGKIILETGGEVAACLVRMQEDLDRLRTGKSSGENSITLNCDSYAMLRIVPSLLGQFFCSPSIYLHETSLVKAKDKIARADASQVFLLSFFESLYSPTNYLQEGWKFTPLIETKIGIMAKEHLLNGLESITPERAARLPIAKHEDETADVMYDYIFRDFPLLDVRLCTRDNAIIKAWLENGGCAALSDSYSSYLRIKSGFDFRFIPISGNYRTVVGLLHKTLGDGASHASLFVDRCQKQMLRASADYLASEEWGAGGVDR